MKNPKKRNTIIAVSCGVVTALTGIVILVAAIANKKDVPVTVTPTVVVEPTKVPTVAPTKEPTEAPTKVPTEEPTKEPTEAPTEVPTEVPTETPTVAPTEEPTEAPTEEPTEVPTEEPTKVPTETPTEAPTEEPTPTPTEVPTEAPTKEPTPTPTDVPTKAPTEVPTKAPTEAPTEVPTPTPTDVPAERSDHPDKSWSKQEIIAYHDAIWDGIVDEALPYAEEYGWELQRLLPDPGNHCVIMTKGDNNELTISVNGLGLVSFWIISNDTDEWGVDGWYDADYIKKGIKNHTP